LIPLSSCFFGPLRNRLRDGSTPASDYAQGSAGPAWFFRGYRTAYCFWRIFPAGTRIGSHGSQGVWSSAVGLPVWPGSNWMHRLGRPLRIKLLAGCRHRVIHRLAVQTSGQRRPRKPRVRHRQSPRRRQGLPERPSRPFPAMFVGFQPGQQNTTFNQLAPAHLVGLLQPQGSRVPFPNYPHMKEPKLGRPTDAVRSKVAAFNDQDTDTVRHCPLGRKVTFAVVQGTSGPLRAVAPWDTLSARTISRGRQGVLAR
jgi:hypothetical protein